MSTAGARTGGSRSTHCRASHAQRRQASRRQALLALLPIAVAAPASAASTTAPEPFLKSSGARGLFADEEEAFFKKREEAEMAARNELDKDRRQFEMQARKNQIGLCAPACCSAMLEQPCHAPSNSQMRPCAQNLHLFNRELPVDATTFSYYAANLHFVALFITCNALRTKPPSLYRITHHAVLVCARPAPFDTAYTCEGCCCATCRCATPFGVDIVGITELVALVGAVVGGLAARQRKREAERLNEQLRKINMQLRQQVCAHVVVLRCLTNVYVAYGKKMMRGPAGLSKLLNVYS